MSASVSLHWVTPENASLLDVIASDVFDQEVKPELLRQFLSNPSNLLVVAVAYGEVVGMATGIAYVHPDKPLSLFVNEVGVADHFQRQGIGRRLMSAILERGTRLGCSEAWVATEVGNTAARALYEACGGLPDEEHAVVYVYPLAGQAAPHE
jgi:ribosomal protein S18 acetylase RimI-like enzyme